MWVRSVVTDQGVVVGTVRVRVRVHEGGGDPGDLVEQVVFGFFGDAVGVDDVAR